MAAVVLSAAIIVSIVPAIVPKITQIRQIITCIGFDNALQREIIINDALMSYDDIQALTVNDISDLSDTFGR